VLSIILTVQAIFCFVVSSFYFFFRNQIGDSYYYVDWTDLGNGADAVVVYFTYLVLLNTMIPISLIVSIEIVKLFQKYFIDRDQFMFSEWRQQGVSVKSASLNEELGQIEYVFSDKTGTLTKNVMEFKIAAIEKKLFGDLTLIAPRNELAERPADHEKGFHDDRLKAILENRA
jgi:P-type E1-E2 ATPase